MPTRYEFAVWAEGQARDAAGHLLDSNGQPIIESDEHSEDTTEDTEEKS